MFNFLFGVVFGALVVTAALNPAEAKRMLGGAVDTVHSSYSAGAAAGQAAMNAPTITVKPAATPAPKAKESE